MTTSRNAGRGVGALLALHLAGGVVLPYILLARLLAAPGFLENAAHNAAHRAPPCLCACSVPPSPLVGPCG